MGRGLNDDPVIGQKILVMQPDPGEAIGIQNIFLGKVLSAAAIGCLSDPHGSLPGWPLRHLSIA